ncbi:glycosyltransferase family 2 protein [Candidatus Pelagibacter sp. Uisw_130]|uniref:glycosyltransferase family 2 protein n=1 Tax=Candidatus Pelagibacter sp. Uisw_130 TaxID=3230989 RepID=UPI0039E7E67F
MRKLVISLVSYNINILELSKVLSFVKKIKNIQIKVHIFDNANQKSLLKFCIKNRYNYFAPKKNIGFGCGHNYNIKQTIKNNPYYLILNPDIYLKPNDVISSINLLNKKKKFGLLSPKLVNTDGTTQLICRSIPSIFNFFVRFFFSYDAFSIKIHQKINSFKKCKFILNVPFIHGACYFIKAEVIKKVGSYDKNFFLYVEDLDWYRRIFEKFDTIYFKSIKVTHVHNQTSHKSLRIFIMHLKSILYYYSKWGIMFDFKRKIINKNFFKKLTNKRI